jgi:hypothetical protein
MKQNEENGRKQKGTSEYTRQRNIPETIAAIVRHRGQHVLIVRRTLHLRLRINFITEETHWRRKESN